MLKPYICATCERVIIEQIVPLPGSSPIPDPTGPTSLISLFSKLYVQANATGSGETIPPNAVIPREWAIYTEWDTEPGDETKHYELCAQLLYPDGTFFGEQVKYPVNVSLHRRSQVIVKVGAFPIGQAGIYTARVWIEENRQRVSESIDLRIELILLNPTQGT